MEAELMSTETKSNLMTALQKGDENAIRSVINEISRLESLVRGYELSIHQSLKALNSPTFKNPDQFHPQHKQ